jgi:hypothetical protein
MVHTKGACLAPDHARAQARLHESAYRIDGAAAPRTTDDPQWFVGSLSYSLSWHFCVRMVNRQPFANKVCKPNYLAHIRHPTLLSRLAN